MESLQHRRLDLVYEALREFSHGLLGDDLPVLDDAQAVAHDGLSCPGNRRSLASSLNARTGATEGVSLGLAHGMPASVFLLQIGRSGRRR